MTWFVAILGAIIAGFTGIVTFLDTGIYDLFTKSFEYLTKTLTLWEIQFLTWAMEVANSTITLIFNDLTLASDIESAWNMLPSEVIQTLVFFNFPQAVAIIFGAYITRFVLRLIPFSGF